MESKKYSLTWEDMDENNKTSEDLAVEILNDPMLPSLKEIIVGCFTPGYDRTIQPLLDKFVENKEKLAHIDSIFFGDMNYEECEVSWIEQGNYSEVINALPNLKKLIIKGSNELTFGEELNHNNLEHLEIICGGLPAKVIESIGQAKLPKLKTLLLYLGVENYGFDGDIKAIQPILSSPNFTSLKTLGILDSEKQDEVIEVVLESEMLKQLEDLNLSYGVLTDKGGKLLLDNVDKLKHLKEIVIQYHYLTDEMIEKLEKSDIPVILSDQNKAEEYNGEFYYNAYLTE